MSKGTRWMGAALTTLFACGLATEAGGQQPQYNFGPCPQTSVILGTEGPDTITGTPNADTILSFGANDIVDGQANRDCIMLGTGNDGGTGSGQADRVFGEQGNDRVGGGEGNDRVDGDSGNDRVVGNPGRDRLRGEGGRDRLSGGPGNDQGSGGAGNDRVRGGSGNDDLGGGSGNDTVNGDDGRDDVSGGAGNDKVVGGSAKDSMSGGRGNDRLNAVNNRRDTSINCGPGRDRAVIDRLWNPFVAAWYEGGKDDPKLLLLRMDLSHAKIWKDGSSLVAYALTLLGLAAVGLDLLCFVLVMLALLDPSRESIPEYSEYLGAIQREARRVNDRFELGQWTPIDLRIEDNFAESVAAYKQFDVLLVNAIFDGMNLIAKEAPLVNSRDGVLVLSENAGAHDELGDWALTVNPFDVEGQAEALYAALTMRAEERRRRLAAIRAHVEEHDIAGWIDSQLADLAAVERRSGNTLPV